MKILFLTEFFPASKKLQFTGGVEARTYFTANHLAKKDKVLVICRKTKKLFKKKHFGNILVYPSGSKAKKAEASFPSLFGRILFMFSAFKKGLSLKFDVVEGSNVVSFLPAFLLAKFKKKPAVAWYPDVLGSDWFAFFGVIGFFGFLLEALSLKLNWSRVIALSKATKKKLLKKGVKEDKITVVYGGVDLDVIKKAKLSRKNKSSKRKKQIVCISRLIPYKKVNDLVKAFSLLNKKKVFLKSFKNEGLFKLFIVGKGPEERKLKNLVSFYHLNDRVFFLKNLSRTNIVKLLKQSYLFCLPSIIEGFGLVTVEAAACRLPFVITDIPVNKEITYNGQGGLLFKKEDVKDLSTKLEKLILDKSLYKDKQKQGVKLAKNYNWPKIAEQTRKVYKQAGKQKF
jgi:glycosyltransferase involved in cell wall biosynthesis